ncbi:MAG: hypothetical protein ACYTGC_06570 [Planctomycetota bacterium]|jgi:hypothetical protein
MPSLPARLASACLLIAVSVASAEEEHDLEDPTVATPPAVGSGDDLTATPTTKTIDVVIVADAPPAFGSGEMPADDCNRNGTPDHEEIRDDPSLDANGNGAIDRCELGADLNGDGRIDAQDLAELIGHLWLPCEADECRGDLDGDSDVDVDDLLLLLTLRWDP